MTTALPDTQFIMEFGTFAKFFFKDDGVISLLLPLLLQFQDNRIFSFFFYFLVFENFEMQTFSSYSLKYLKNPENDKDYESG